jgi:hypothetical protein
MAITFSQKCLYIYDKSLVRQSNIFLQNVSTKFIVITTRLRKRSHCSMNPVSVYQNSSFQQWIDHLREILFKKIAQKSQRLPPLIIIKDLLQ